MKIHYALLAYSADLTSPSAKSIPVALVAAGARSPTEGFVFFYALPQLIAASNDPFGIVRELPRFLDARIREGLPASSPSEFLGSLRPRLGQSLALREPQSMDVEDSTDLESELFALSRRNLTPEAPPRPESTPTSYPAFRFEPVGLHGA